MESVVEANRPDPAVSVQTTTEPRFIRGLLITIVLLFIFCFLVIPLISIFAEAFRHGVKAYFAAISSSNALSSIKLSLLVVLVVVPINTIFGVLTAWAFTKFQFKGKSVLMTLSDLPFSVSPVIAGLIFILLLGRNSFLGPWLMSHNINIIFNTPGIILVTLFVTYPFVSRELIPLMNSQGTSEEEASLILGANGWQTFFRVTLPNIKWGLLYGIILCSARAIGEFGAVAVVSGNIAGSTNTMPLQINAFYNQYQTTAAFALASVMSLIAIVTLIIKSLLEWKTTIK